MLIEAPPVREVTSRGPVHKAAARYGLVWGGLVVFFFCFITVAYVALSKAEATVASVNQANAFTREFAHLRRELVNAETGQRGYLLTGQISYLAPYNAALPEIQRHTQTLLVFSEGDPGLLEEVQGLRNLIRQKLEELALTIDLARNDKRGNALQVVETGQGRRLMEEAQRRMEHMDQTVQRNAQARSSAAAAIIPQLRFGLLALTLFSAGLMLSGFWKVSRASRLQEVAAGALDEVTRRHLLAVDAAELGTWSVDLNTNVVLCSDRFLQVFGFPQNFVPTRDDIRAAIHPDDLERVLEAIRKSIEEDPLYNVEYRIVWRDKSVHWIKVKGFVYKDAAGKPIRMEGAAVRMDEQEIARQALHTSEQRYTALFQNKVNAVSHGRSIFDDRGKAIDFETIQVNAAYESITGLKKEAIEGRRITEAVPGIQSNFDFIGTFGRVAREGTPASFEFFSESFGKWLSFHVYSPAPDEFVAIIEDITPRKKAEEALRASEERLRLAQSVAGMGTWEWNARTKIASVTPELYKLYGAEPGTLETLDSLQAYLHPDDRERVVTLRRGLASRGGSLDMEYRVVTSQGESRWVHGRGAAMHDPAGALISLIGVSLDITDRKAMETELRQLNETLEERVAQRTQELNVANRELESANRELEAFSYSVSHDLRAPLRGVDGFARILVKDVGPRLEPNAARYLQLILRSSQKMGELIDDLLLFSRLSRQPLRKEKVDMRVLVNDAIEELQAGQNGGNLRIVVGDLPACIGEPRMLKQVWINLLSNAIKFSISRTDAAISIGSQPATAERDQTYFIRDNGAGFDMKYAGKLFGMFQRLHRAEDYEGTGVGLAIVARIVHRHGGVVEAYSEPDKGAKFSFTLGPA